MEYDVLIRGGSVVDGTGSAARRADVGVTGDRVSMRKSDELPSRVVVFVQERAGHRILGGAQLSLGSEASTSLR